MTSAFHIPSRNDRWVRQLADEICEIRAHGGRGSFHGLIEHLSVRFGNVEEADVQAAIALLPAWSQAKECFK